MLARTFSLRVLDWVARTDVARSTESNSIEHLVVFGDSYSDEGNIYELSNKTWPAPAYFPDGRFSNGTMWPEYVSKSRRLVTANFAYGSATSDSAFIQGYSGTASDIPVPGLPQQLDNYRQSLALAATTPSHPISSIIKKSLFVVHFQGNDFFFAPDVDPTLVMANLEKGIRQLIDKDGAKNVLVIKNLDFGRLPYVAANPTLSAFYSSISAKLKQGYLEMEKRFRKEYGRLEGGRHPFRNNRKNKVQVVFMDLEEWFLRWQTPRQQRRLGITNVVKGCMEDDHGPPCGDPRGHFFYDPFHPTTRIQEEIGKVISAYF